MKRVSLFVTPDGEWVTEGSSEFFAALGDTEPDYDASLFAVKNLGFIKYQIVDNTLIEIELHPRNVGFPAMLAVQQQILRSTVKLFRIRYFKALWSSEITSSAEQAVSRLSELSAASVAPPSQDRFVVEPGDYSKLFADESNPMRLMAQKWRVSFGHFDPTMIAFASRHSLLSRMIIVGIKRDGKPMFRFIGDGHSNWLDSTYHLRAVGETVADQPDKDYGNWVSEFYKHVAETGEPRYDFVTAAIRRPPDTYLTRYERLLLPWKTPSDEVLVTVWSRGIPTEGESNNSSFGEDDSVSRKLARSS